MRVAEARIEFTGFLQKLLGFQIVGAGEFEEMRDAQMISIPKLEDRVSSRHL